MLKLLKVFAPIPSDTVQPKAKKGLCARPMHIVLLFSGAASLPFPEIASCVLSRKTPSDRCVCIFTGTRRLSQSPEACVSNGEIYRGGPRLIQGG